MAVTGTSVAAAAIFITFVLCFYLFLCAKRHRGARGRARLVFAGGAADGMAEPAVAALPRKEVAPGDPAADCAVCIAELAPGEDARVLPRCGHRFHVECVGAWLRSHSTCPLCRCAVVAAERAARPPEADPESPAFPTNVLFFGSQDAVSTLLREPAPGPVAGVAAVVEAARVAALRRLLGCRGATPSPPSPPQQEARDLESGIGGGESSGSPPAKPQSGC